jgi:Uma2 family endonuclease
MLSGMTQTAERMVVTADEYLTQERRSETKHELIDGEIVAMAGTSLRHSTITINVGAALRPRLRGRCRVFDSNARVHVESTGLFTYPDVTVACGELQYFNDGGFDTLLNPTLLVEVLSPSTEAYDRGAKFQHYQSIPSFVHYVLVSQEERHVDYFQRLETGQWLLTVHKGEDATLAVPRLGFEIPLAEIYEGAFDLPPPRAG